VFKKNNACYSLPVDWKVR